MPSLLSPGDVEVFQLGDVLTYESGLMIDADRAPNAYHPAGQVSTQAGDPFPGFYVSATSLEDPTFVRTDPRR